MLFPAVWPNRKASQAHDRQERTRCQVKSYKTSPLPLQRRAPLTTATKARSHRRAPKVRQGHGGDPKCPYWTRGPSGGTIRPPRGIEGSAPCGYSSYTASSPPPLPPREGNGPTPPSPVREATRKDWPGPTHFREGKAPPTPTPNDRERPPGKSWTLSRSSGGPYTPLEILGFGRNLGVGGGLLVYPVDTVVSGIHIM
jgi:hypothetical protein